MPKTMATLKDESELRTIRIQKHGPEMYILDERWKGEKRWTHLTDVRTYRHALHRAISSLGVI